MKTPFAAAFALSLILSSPALAASPELKLMPAGGPECGAVTMFSKYLRKGGELEDYLASLDDGIKARSALKSMADNCAELAKSVPDAEKVPNATLIGVHIVNGPGGAKLPMRTWMTAPYTWDKIAGKCPGRADFKTNGPGADALDHTGMLMYFAQREDRELAQDMVQHANYDCFAKDPAVAQANALIQQGVAPNPSAGTPPPKTQTAPNPAAPAGEKKQ
jgi:hypothetical protein